jgi:hypothetical protein
MKMLVHILIFTGIILGLSCKKSTTPIVESSISASVNGQTYHNTYCISCLGGGSGLSQYFSNNVLNINSEMAASGFNHLNLTLQNVTGPGTYSLSLMGKSSNFASFELIPNGQSTTTYVTDNTYTGSVLVTKFDAGHHIISGTFQFDAVNTANGADVVHVTNGQFAILYTSP